MRRARSVALALTLFVVTASPAGPVAAASDDPTAFAVGQQFDRVQFQVVVRADGAARWTFHYERTLSNATERERYERFANEFTANETILYRDFVNQSRTLAREGERATDRAMAAEDFSRDARVVTQLNDVGVLEMSFTWIGFARLDGERVIVGDVFEGGLYIGPDQSLVVVAGDGLVFRDVRPEGTLSGGDLATSDSVTWQGERSFTDNRPRIVLAPPASAADGGDAGADGANGEPETGASSPLGLLLVGVIVLAGVGLFLYRRHGDVTGTLGSLVGESVGVGAGSDVEDAALLDDEERVDDLLRERGGRMRQSAIVEATGWSKSKVSMVLSEMEEAGQVRKLRVGRENIISLPGHEPEAARSSLEDPE